jgi:hypothetical protein
VALSRALVYGSDRARLVTHFCCWHQAAMRLVDGGVPRLRVKLTCGAAAHAPPIRADDPGCVKTPRMI